MSFANKATVIYAVWELDMAPYDDDLVVNDRRRIGSISVRTDRKNKSGQWDISNRAIARALVDGRYLNPSTARYLDIEGEDDGVLFVDDSREGSQLLQLEYERHHDIEEKPKGLFGEPGTKENGGDPEDDDYLITDARSGGYMLTQNNRSLGKYRTRDAAFAAAQNRADRSGVYSNIFYMNERGTVDLLDTQGNFAMSNPISSLSTTEKVGIAAAGVAVVGIVGYLIWKSQQTTPALAVGGTATSPGSTVMTPLPGVVDQTPPFVPGFPAGEGPIGPSTGGQVYDPNLGGSGAIMPMGG